MGLLAVTFYKLAQMAAQASLFNIIGAAELSFSIFRLILLVGWIYLCLYCVQKVQLNPTLSEGTKTVANIFSFFAGPVILAFLLIKDIRSHSESEGKGFVDSAKHIFSNLVTKVGDMAHSDKGSIDILDTAGRSIKELYADSRNTTIDRRALNLTQQIIVDAIERDASDILIDPKGNSTYLVRFRIDGVLQEVEMIDEESCRAVINSIKAVSKMDIAERRRPLDGAFVVHSGDEIISFRVASAGVLNGEKLSIRVLNQNAGRFQLDSIGLSDKQSIAIERAIKKPSGMILMCGPTGSGKTTTLYAMLNKIDLMTRNVITVEDPIEYVLPQASQIEVNTKAGITFAKSLRSILRQDPDIICVGEIRDEETAQIALRASQTGHLVLATIHSTSNASTLIRLMDLGVTQAMISTGLTMIVSQRLVRKLCEKCKEPANLSSRQIQDFRKKMINYKQIHQAKGCQECNFTGYRGRMGIYDVLIIDDTIKQNILNNEVAMSELRKTGERKGKSNLQKQCLKKVVCGETSLDELNRVLGHG